MGKQNQSKQNEIIFSKEIDDKINGFAVVITFIITGLFLIFNMNYFGNLMVSNIIRWIFIAIGILGFFVEFPKIIKNKIKGISDFILGIVFLSIWAICFFSRNIWLINIISLFFFVFGLFGSLKGFFEIICSLRSIRREHIENKGIITVDVLLIISHMLGIALVIIQIIKALNYMSS